MKPLPDADQAAALGRHRDARARPGAARAHRLVPSSRRPASWARRWSPSSSPTPTARSSAATTSTTSARRVGALRGAHRVAAALKPGARLHRLHGRGQVDARRARRPRRSASAADDADALLEAELGEPIAGVLRRARARRRSAPREEELVGALLERADGGVDRARRRRAAVRARARGAARATPSCCSTSTSTRPGRARTAQRPPARPRPRRLRARSTRARGRSTRRPPTPSCRRPARARRARARSPRCGRSPDGPPPAVGARAPRATTRCGSGRCERAPWPRGRAAASSSATRPSPRCTRGARARRGRRSIEIPPGEEHKTLATAERVWRALVAQGATRADHVVALGGGVVGDLAGFCAATYQRGIAGRAGADDARRPGRLGLRRQDRRRPARGQELRRRLPPARGGARRPGAAGDAAAPPSSPPATPRCVKTALIAGGPLWERVAAGRARRRRRDRRPARARSCASSPPTSATAALRQVLNLGHTVGHAIETVTGYAPLPPRRGGRPRPARRAAPVRPGRAARRRSRSCSPRAGLPTRLDGVDADAVGRRDRARQEAHRARPCRSCSSTRPGDVTHRPRRRRRRRCAPPCES